MPPFTALQPHPLLSSSKKSRGLCVWEEMLRWPQNRKKRCKNQGRGDWNWGAVHAGACPSVRPSPCLWSLAHTCFPWHAGQIRWFSLALTSHLRIMANQKKLLWRRTCMLIPENDSGPTRLACLPPGSVTAAKGPRCHDWVPRLFPLGTGAWYSPTSMATSMTWGLGKE